MSPTSDLINITSDVTNIVGVSRFPVSDVTNIAKLLTNITDVFALPAMFAVSFADEAVYFAKPAA